MPLLITFFYGGCISDYQIRTIKLTSFSVTGYTFLLHYIDNTVFNKIVSFKDEVYSVSAFPECFIMVVYLFVVITWQLCSVNICLMIFDYFLGFFTFSLHMFCNLTKEAFLKIYLTCILTHLHTRYNRTNCNNAVLNQY